MVQFIQRKFVVEEPDASKTHVQGKRGDRLPLDLQSINVFFVGPRGCGKSTLARAVADHFGLVFADTDDLVQQKSQKSIAQIVQEQGWETFRNLEHQVLASVCAYSGQSVATGGGIVLREENKELLQSAGYVFYLLADAKTLQERLADQDDECWRPSLSDLDTDQEIVATLTEREPLYFQVLHYVLPADKPVQELVQDVGERLGGIGGHHLFVTDKK